MAEERIRNGKKGEGGCIRGGHGKVTQPVAMKSSLWSVVVLTFLVGQSWSQRPRDRPAPTKRPQQQQQHHQQSASDDSELTDECPEPNGYFADGYQCDKYYECKEGAITEKLCPDGMVFNDYSTMYEKCDLPFNIDCSQRSLMQDPKPSANCPRQNGYFAHNDVTICDKFYFCVDGKFNMITCPSGLVYNEKTGICTWPDEAKKKHCSSQAGEEKVRTRRVAFWKSDEDTSKDMSGGEEEDSGSYEDSGSVEKSRRPKPSVLDYGSAGSAEYPDYEDGSESKEPNYDNKYGNYESYDDPEFSNFDQDFQNFANAGSSGMSYPGLTPHDFLRRKKDNVDELDELDEYIGGYVGSIGKNPKTAAMGMDTKYYEQIAEKVFDQDEEKGNEHNSPSGSTPSFRQPLPGATLFKKPVYKSTPSVGNLRPGQPYTGPVLTLQKPVHGVKWNYMPKPGRHLQPPPAPVDLLDPNRPPPLPFPTPTVSSRQKACWEELTKVMPFPGTSQGSLLSSSEVFKFDCPKVDEKRAQQHPRYPDPEDCQFFYVCINGEVPRRNGCKLGQVFNEASGNCDWPRSVPECKDWYKGVLTDEELEALEHPKPKVRNSNYTTAAQKRKRPHQS